MALIECCVLFGGIMTDAITLRMLSPEDKVEWIASLVMWIYTAIHACLRLPYVNPRSNHSPDLCNHTASLYCARWLIAVL